MGVSDLDYYGKNEFENYGKFDTSKPKKDITWREEILEIFDVYFDETTVGVKYKQHIPAVELGFRIWEEFKTKINGVKIKYSRFKKYPWKPAPEGKELWIKRKNYINEEVADIDDPSLCNKIKDYMISITSENKEVR
jgi:hypothetical protein